MKYIKMKSEVCREDDWDEATYREFIDKFQDLVSSFGARVVTVWELLEESSTTP